jgi:hypothetical protein
MNVIAVLGLHLRRFFMCTSEHRYYPLVHRACMVIVRNSYATLSGAGVHRGLHS